MKVQIGVGRLSVDAGLDSVGLGSGAEGIFSVVSYREISINCLDVACRQCDVVMRD